jgi:hypothetical protein
MSAVALEAARSAGISVGIDGGDLVLQASAPPPPAVLAVLSRHKAAIVALLRPPSPALFAEWRAGVASLRTMAGPRVRPDRWQQTMVDAGRFLDHWGAQAAALGWSTLDVFGAHPTHPTERLDCAGLIILLHGDELAAFTADITRFRNNSGALLTYYRRRRQGAVPLWELRPPQGER